MHFGQATLRAQEEDAVIRRSGWNGKGMYVYWEDPTRSPSNAAYGPFKLDGYFVMFTAQKTFQRGWITSQQDMNAHDWEIIAATDAEHPMQTLGVRIPAGLLDR